MGAGAGRRVLITGAAGGIGAAGARAFAGGGAAVVGVDVDDGAGRRLFDELGPPHAYRHLDLTDAEAVAAGVQEAADLLGGLDLVWLNAGVMTRARNLDALGDPLSTLTAEGYRRVFDVNVGANVAAIAAAVPILRAGGGGDVVVTASAAGLSPFVPDPVYTASKHAVIGLVRSLGPALEGTGVRVHAVCPGGTDTPMAGPVPEADRGQLQPPEAVAEAVLAIVGAGATGDAWTALAGRPPVRIRFPELRGRGFVLDPDPAAH